MYSPEWAVVPEIDDSAAREGNDLPAHELPDRITDLRREMMEAAERLEYERAAELRDRIKQPGAPGLRTRMKREAAAASVQPPGSAHQHENESARGRGERHTAKDASEKPSLLPRGRGRGRGRGAAPAPPRQGSLKSSPTSPSEISCAADPPLRAGRRRAPILVLVEVQTWLRNCLICRSRRRAAACRPAQPKAHGRASRRGAAWRADIRVRRRPADSRG